MRLNNLQALRGIACLLVVAFHIPALKSADGSTVPVAVLAPLQYFGFAGVDLFFVLSGFVITWVNVETLGDRSRLRGYIGRRLWRIYPVYWVCLCLALPAQFDVLPTDAWQYLTGYLSAGRLTRFLLLVPTKDINLLLPQAWTLTFEILFYLAFAGFFLLPRRAFLPLLGTWAAAVIGTALLPAAAGLRASILGASILDPLIIEFLLGCGAAMAICRGWTRWGRAILAAGLVGFVAGGIATYSLTVEIAGRHTIRTMLFGIPAALIVFGTVAVERSRGSTLPRWLQIVGDASYPIYLVHIAIFGCMAERLVGMSDATVTQIVAPGAMATVGVAGGFLIHFAVERPLLALGRRSTPPSPAVELRRAA